MRAAGSGASIGRTLICKTSLYAALMIGIFTCGDGGMLRA